MAYPIFVNLSGRSCVVIGGGRVAERRAEVLLEQGGKITLVAPEITASLKKLQAMGLVEWLSERYEPRHIDGAFLVMAATDDPEVNAAVTRDARERNILVCRTDEPNDGTFIAPAMIERGGLTIALATGGGSPTLAAVLRARLQNQFGPEWAQWTQLFAKLRPIIKQIEPDSARRGAVERILDDMDVRTQIERSDLAAAEEGALRCISSLPA